MKKIISLLVALAVTVSVFGAFPVMIRAEKIYTEGAYTYTVNGGYATITAFDEYYDENYDGVLYMPDTLGGYEVKEIGEYAFRNCWATTYIQHLPSALEKIGRGAFEDCGSLIEMPYMTKLVEIPDYAFRGCYSLEKINFHEGLKRIGEDAFAGCAIERLDNLPSSLEYIGPSAFYGCTELRFAKIPKGVTASGYYNEEEEYGTYGYWFSGTDIITEVEFESGTVRIPEYALANSGVQKVIIPDSVTEIGEGAFVGCAMLEELRIPHSVTKVGETFADGFGDLVVYCHEASPIAKMCIDNFIKFELTGDLEEYEYFENEYTDFEASTAFALGYIPFKVKFKVKEGKNINPLCLRVLIPRDSEPIFESVEIAGVESAESYMVYEYFEIPIEEMQEAEIDFSFSVSDYSNLRTCAEIIFEENGEEKRELIGLINCSAPTLAMYTDRIVNKSEIKVEGVTVPDGYVSILLDGEFVSEVQALKTGKYSAVVELPEVEQYKRYKLCANTTVNGEYIEVINDVIYQEDAPVLDTLVMNYGDDSGKRYRCELTDTDSGRPAIVFYPGAEFEFEAKFENTDKVGDVYIVSTRNGEEKCMEATWDEASQSYVAKGYFDNDRDYVPGTITVEYTKKRPEVSIKEAFDAEKIIGYMEPSVKDIEVEVQENTDSRYKSSFNMPEELKELICDEIDLTVTTLTKDYKDENVENLMGTVDNVYSYFFEEDGDKYFLNLEPDGETVNMIVHDISGDKTINYALDFLDVKVGKDELTAIPASEALGNINYVTGIFSDVYDIQSDHEELKDSIRKSNMTPEEKEEALKKAEALKTDRELFLAATMLIGVATIGVTGPSAVAFGLLFGAVEASSGFFWEARMANMLGKNFKINCNWVIDPSGYVYEGVTSNRIEDVTCSAYWIEKEYIEDGVGDESYAHFWEATEYEQINPLVTDANGRYRWDVPEGLWKVVFEKEGYETYETEWLPVPPPQTEVNVGIVSYRTPQIESVVYADNKVYVKFDKYMQPDSVQIEIDGVLKDTEYDKTQTNTAGENFADLFICDADTDADEIVVNVFGGVCYAGEYMHNYSANVLKTEDNPYDGSYVEILNASCEARVVNAEFVRTSHIGEDFDILCVFYDEEGCVVDACSKRDVLLEIDERRTYSFEAKCDYYSAKLFVWNSKQKMIPAGDCKSIKN